MTFRVVRHRKAPAEFFQLPSEVRAVFEEAVQRMSTDPYASGAGYEVAQLSPPPGVVAPVWSMKVDGFRMFYVVDGDTVKIGGFGVRPGFYRKLSRVKELVRGG
ncbi:MAG: hypothetical protein ACREBZ_07790 [Thermoplasmata archaeon]